MQEKVPTAVVAEGGRPQPMGSSRSPGASQPSAGTHGTRLESVTAMTKTF
jgi:hypothetical protein